MKHFVASLALGALILTGALASSATAATSYFQGFEVDTYDWVGTVNREASGSANPTYASGVSSAAGAFHARLPIGAPHTKFGGYEATFPAGGYSTSTDIYLDTAFAATHADYRFDWTSAINNPAGAHLQDFVFNAGTNATGFIIGASTNAGRANSFPSNPCPNPSASPNDCRTPASITTSGWYTFRHTFTDAGGFLDVQLTIIDASDAVVADWTIHTGHAMAAVGGHRYGWFANQEINDLVIDNVELAGDDAYTFEGFGAPIDNEDLNKAVAGQTIPVKWRLLDGTTPVSDSSSFVSLTSQQVTCGTLDFEGVDAIETYTNESGLIYQGDGNWQFNWQTKKAYKGQCRVMTLTLSDDTTYTADFKFK